MAGGQAFGAQTAGQFRQVGELHGLVAANAGNRGFSRRIAVGKVGDHRLGETGFGIDHVMRDAQPVGDALGVMDILTGAAGALAPGRGALIVEL